MYVSKIVFIFFILVHQLAYADFYKTTKDRWSSAIEVKLNPNYSKGLKISEPRGTVQVVAEIYIQNTNFDILKDCIIYKIPDGNKLGEVKIISILKDQKCEKQILTSSKVVVSNIFNFGIEFIGRKISLKIDTKNYNYMLFNLVLPKKYRLDDSSASNTYEPGIFISFLKDKNATSLKQGEVCFDINDNCEITRKDICHLCPSKVLSVVANSCKTSYRKYCKPIVCGAKGMPACIRGYRASQYLGNYCIPGSPVGFCQKPFKVFCENKELICR